MPMVAPPTYYPPAEWNDYSAMMAPAPGAPAPLAPPPGVAASATAVPGAGAPSPPSPASLSAKRKAKKPSAPALLKPVTKRLRMGCLTCRQRKKRCCETRPKCTECARLKLNCQWPKPGTEHKNKNKDAKIEENTIDHEVFGKIKVLRGIVERK